MSNEYSIGRLAELWDETSVATMIIGLDDGIIYYINDAVCHDIGKEKEEIIGHSYKAVFWPEFLYVYDQLRKECGDGKTHSTIYFWAEKTLWEQISAKNVVWQDKNAILLTITNISELALGHYESDNAAYFNVLLGLPNGYKLEEDINTLYGLEEVSLIYFRIESLDTVNNLYGWSAGDALLLQIRNWIMESEFQRIQLYYVDNGFVMLGRAVNFEGAKDRAKEIVERFHEPWFIYAEGAEEKALPFYCTIKLGIVQGKYVKNEMRNLLMRTLDSKPTADGYSIYNEEADLEIRDALYLRNSLISSVFGGMTSFSVYYQPIVETGSETWRGVEALCRWTTPDGINVPPSVFINIAEKLGIVGTIDAWVWRTAMEHCVALGLDQKDFYLDLNYSPTQRVDDSFMNELFSMINETGFPAEKINIEIIESAKMDFSEETLAGLRLIAEHGIKLSLDDFGTGYATFENLYNISASTLKTEKILLDNIENDSYRQYMFTLLTNISKDLNMSLIAEGVETSEQLDILKNHNVGLAQGFFYSKPLPYAELEKRVSNFK